MESASKEPIPHQERQSASSSPSSPRLPRRFALLCALSLGALILVLVLSTTKQQLPGQQEYVTTTRLWAPITPPAGLSVKDPEEALRLALANDAAQPLFQDVVSDADAERCIWNNPVMQRCSAQQWKRRLLRQVLKDYRLYDKATDEIKRMVTPDPDCEEFFSRGDLRRFPTNADGLAERYSWEFAGDSNTRAMFLAFLDLFDDSAMAPFKCKTPMQQCENAGRGTINDERYYQQLAVFNPRPILLQPKKQQQQQQPVQAKAKRVPESDLLESKQMGPWPGHAVSDGYVSNELGRNPVVLLEGKEVQIHDNNSITEVDSSTPLSEKLAALETTPRPTSGGNVSLSSSLSPRSLLRVFLSHDTHSVSLSTIRQRQVLIADPLYMNLSWRVPPQLWRREAVRSYLLAREKRNVSSSLTQQQQQQEQQQQPVRRFRPESLFTPHADILTNSDRPKIIPRSDLHQDLMSVYNSMIVSVAKAKSLNFTTCSRRLSHFNDCIEMAPASELGKPDTVFYQLRSEEKIQQYLASGRSNEQEMRAATRFGFSNVMEEFLIKSSLDYQWRYILHLSTRRNVHLSVFHEIHTIADRAPSMGYVGVNQFVRESQGAALRKVLRFEIMRAAGVLPADPSSIVDQSLREDQQESYFVDRAERDVLRVFRRRWNSSAEFEGLTRDDGINAYHARNARKLIITDVHVAARKYIREELIGQVKSPAALRAMGRLMARTFFTDAYTGQEVRDFCRKELGKRGLTGRMNTTCHAMKDSMHFRRDLEQIPLQNLIASVIELERCRRTSKNFNQH